MPTPRNNLPASQSSPHMPKPRSRPRPRRRRSVPVSRLLIASALRAVLLLLCLLLAFLLVCGCLYVREHFFPGDSGPGSGTDPREGDSFAGDQPGTGAGLPADSPLPTVYLPAASPEPLAGGGVVVLDAGHGGVQAGCAIDGVLEKNITLAVALLVRDRLQALGVSVCMVREEDLDVSLDRRCQIANGAHADLFVSIHCNSFPEDTSVSGLEGYYHASPEGQRLAQHILDAAGALGIQTRHVRDENYQVLRDTAMPAALMEIGFLSNPEERRLLQSPEYQDTVAQAVAEGICAMLESLQ